MVINFLGRVLYYTCRLLWLSVFTVTLLFTVVGAVCVLFLLEVEGWCPDSPS